MKCPKCNVTLIMSERLGIEIDYCPECRGIWLDRGELDKIIERTNGSETNTESRRNLNNYHSYDRHPHKKNWLNDLFD